MSLPKCPNKSHRDYKLMVRLFGEDNALYLYDAFDETIPTREQIAQVYRREKKDVLSNTNNPDVWDVENIKANGIATWSTKKGGKKTKKYVRYTPAEARVVIEGLKKAYPDVTFAPKKVNLVDSKNIRIDVSTDFGYNPQLGVFKELDITPTQLKIHYEQKQSQIKSNITDYIKEYKYADKKGNLNVKKILKDIVNNYRNRFKIEKEAEISKLENKIAEYKKQEVPFKLGEIVADDRFGALPEYVDLEYGITQEDIDEWYMRRNEMVAKIENEIETIKNMPISGQASLLENVAMAMLNRQKNLEDIEINIVTLKTHPALETTMADYLRNTETVTEGRIRMMEDNLSDLDVFYATFLHEVVHHYTIGKINSFQDWDGVSPQYDDTYYEEIHLEDFENLDQIQQIADTIYDIPGADKRRYGFTKTELKDKVDIAEFISEYMSKRTFRSHVNKLMDKAKIEFDLNKSIADLFFNGIPTGEDMLTRSERKDFERKKEILLANFPWVTEVIEDTSLNVLGNIDINKGNVVIRVNPISMERDTIGHEFGHLLVDLIGGLNNPLVRAGLKQLENTKMAQEVRDTYGKDYSEEVVQKEILAQGLGMEVDRLFAIDDFEAKSKFHRWLMRIYKSFKARLGMEKSAVQEMAKMMVGKSDFKVKDMDVIASYEQKKTGIKAIDEVNKIIADEDALVDKTKDILQNRIKAYANVGNSAMVVRLQEKLDELDKMPNTIGQLAKFITIAGNQVEALYRQYETAEEAYKNGDKGAYNARMLNNWYEYISAFDIISDIATMIKKKIGFKEFNAKYKITQQLIKDIVDKKDLIKDAFVVHGKEVAGTFLKKHSTKIISTYKLLAEDAYKELSPEERDLSLKLDNGERMNRTLEEFTDDYLELRADQIEEETEIHIANELDKASVDIGYMARWLDNLLDSNDTVVSAMAKATARQMRNARVKGLEYRDTMYDMTKELEKSMKGKYSVMSSEKMYDSMLEKIDGEYSGHYITKWKSAMMKEYSELVGTLEKAASYEELADVPYIKNFLRGKKDLTELPSDLFKARVKKAWKKNNAPIDNKAFNKAKNAFVQELVNEGKITAEQRELMSDNDMATTPQSLDLLLRDARDVADLVNAWVKEHLWDYRVPIEKWKNPQWAELQALRKKDPKDIRIRYYDFIVESGKNADSMVPFKFRLHSRLPGITKDFNERLLGPQQNFLQASRDAFTLNFVKRVDETTRGLTEGKEKIRVVDENKKVKQFLPVYFSNAVDAKDQSYDIASIYTSRVQMAIDYAYKREILDDMELARYFVEHREVIITDSKGNPIKNANKKLRNRELTKSGMNSLITAQLADWFSSVWYGESNIDTGDIKLGKNLRVDKQKGLKFISKFAAFNMLGINIAQGVANFGLGEIMQRVEAHTKQYYTPRNYAKAAWTFRSELPFIMGDIGRIRPKNKVHLIMEMFDILDDYKTPEKFRNTTKFRNLMQTNTVFFTSHVGEFSMQAKAIMAALDSSLAKDKDGKTIKKKNGKDLTLLDALYVNDKHDLAWKEGVVIDDAEIEHIEFATKRMLSSVHGEYSQLGTVAIQRNALTEMALMFRKFIGPGAKRRWAPSRKLEDGSLQYRYNELSEMHYEGAYLSTLRFAKNLIKDLFSAKQELIDREAKRFSPISDYKGLNELEQANLVRTVSEIGFLVMTALLATVFMTAADDSDNDTEEWAYTFLAYQSVRLKSELFFFFNPVETMRILRSPAATMSVIENLIKLVNLTFNPFDDDTLFTEYQQGDWKGQKKATKLLTNLTPIFKQYHRILNMDTQLSWFVN